MWYIVIIIVAILVISYFNKKTFYWETIIKYLWKQIYAESDKMSYWVQESLKKNESPKDFEDLIQPFKERLDLRGKIINSILDYINKTKNVEGSEDIEEITFGYGRYDFETILHLAKNNPDTFKKL